MTTEHSAPAAAESVVATQEPRRRSPASGPQGDFPHAVLPSGWFQVAWAGEVGPGEVRPLHYFDRDLVLFRTEAGRFQVLDAHCPHMGAHLGYGGRVEGDVLVCPYHGWEWGCDGRNVLVPSTGSPTDRRRVGTWETVTSNGVVWVWHDALGRDPLWPAPRDLPGVAEGQRHTVYPHCVRKWTGVRMRPQYVPENNVDLDHLHWIHGAQGDLELISYGPEGYCFKTAVKITYGYGKERTSLTPDGPIDVVVGAEIWGVGFQFTFFPEPDDAISIQSQTPVDGEHCDLFQTVVVHREPGADPAVPQGMARSRVREQLVQIERDLPIWEHMRYTQHAALTRHEAKPMTALRRWAERFYPSPSDGEEGGPGETPTASASGSPS